MSAWIWGQLRSLLSSASSLQVSCHNRLSTIRASIRSAILRRTEYPLVSIGDQHSVLPSRKQSIPSVVYQVWVKDAFGRRHVSELRAFRALNPELTFKLFSHEDADSYMQSAWSDHPIQKIYQQAQFRALQADIFRYCILFENGGYYFDINKACSASLFSLHPPEATRFLSYETSHCSLMPELPTTDCFQYPDRYLIQWGFGFAPQDPILLRVIDLICAYYPKFKSQYFANPKSAILAFTGPGMFTKAVREIVQEEGKLDGAQAGVNFNGHGIPWMPGSEVRYHLSPPYVLARNAVIVS